MFIGFRWAGCTDGGAVTAFSTPILSCWRTTSHIRQRFAAPSIRSSCRWQC